MIQALVKPDRKTYSMDEVAQILGISRSSAFKAAKEGKLPVVVIKAGRRLLVGKAALDALLDGRGA